MLPCLHLHSLPSRQHAPRSLAGNIKATTPIAFTTTLLVWALMAFGPGFTAAGQAGAALDSIRWGSDYLLKVHKALPGTNNSMIITRVSRPVGRGLERGGRRDDGERRTAGGARRAHPRIPLLARRAMADRIPFHILPDLPLPPPCTLALLACAM